MRPIFLHGVWRSGSTYLWSRFRQSDRTLCFYEPLHHGLAKLTAARIARADPSVVQANRHPALASPYLAEFAPLVRGRGVRHYRQDLAYARYCLGAGERHTALQNYVSTLVDLAQSNGRTAVLGFNRSGGRIGWLKERFDSYDLYIDRDPQAVWASYAAEARAGNRSYFSMWLRVIEANRRDPIWAPLAARLCVDGVIRRTAIRMKHRHACMIDSWRDEDSFFLTLYAALVCSTHASACVDLWIDEQVSASPDLRRRTEAQVAENTGVRVDFSDFAPAASRATLDSFVRDRVALDVLECFPRREVQRLRFSAKSRPAHSGLMGELIADVLGRAVR